MEDIMGSVVKAKAGRDKDSFFVVLENDSKYAIIVDGKRRTLLKPKKKNFKHLLITKSKLVEEDMKTDRGIRKALRKFK